MRIAERTGNKGYHRHRINASARFGNQGAR
jgi:hypothetical protein